jgi:hypothetical protein
MLDFPDSPTTGQIFNSGKGTFSWDGVKWTPVSSAGMGDAPSNGLMYGRKNAAWSQVFSGVVVGDAPPASPSVGQLWWDSIGALMYVYYQDPTGAPQWVAANNSAGIPEAPTDGRIYSRQGSTASWQAQAAGGILSTIVYAASQTIVISAGATQALVQLWGATGGSGGSNGSGQASGGTGAGGYSESFFTGLVPGNTFIYTQGAAGGAGTSGGSPTAGTAGGTTTLASGTQSIPTMTCNGSFGSPAATAANGNYGGTPGGTASGGNLINLTGQSGASSVGTASGGTAYPGAGGVTFYSIGANGTGPSAGNPGNPGGLKITWFIGPAASQTAFAGVQGQAKNLVVTAASPSTHQVTVTADALCVSDGVTNYNTITGINATCDLTLAGAGGLDTGAVAASTWYAIHIIYNATSGAISALASLSATGPLLPSGYNRFARVGWVRTTAAGGGTMAPVIQRGRTAQYTTQPYPTIASGAQGTAAATTFTPVAIPWAPVAPPTAAKLKLFQSTQTYASSVYCYVHPNPNSVGLQGAAFGNGPLMTYYPNLTFVFVVEMLIESANVYYAASGTACGVACAGWEDNI